MKISSYTTLIRELPHLQQAFDIKRSIWKVPHQQELVDEIFVNEEVIRINRGDVFNSNSNIERFIISTLMWGYPTKGRGNNIDRMLEPKHFDYLASVLQHFKDNVNMPSHQIEDHLGIVPGLGLSTITKFLYFLDITIDNQPALILDNQIIKVINSKRFEELQPLEGIRYDNGPLRYPDYLYEMNLIADQLKVDPGQLEYFLFTFGNQLS
ncbi:MAG: hypothetical protein DCO96_15840 [Fluviicola sp. XM-24bin1]|nr:MAG: hypothetical protein DCO96_15840 [Fluviicola sp. XM-24bin1]